MGYQWTSQHLTKTNMNEVSKFRQEMDGILRRELIAISTKNLGPKLHNCVRIKFTQT